MSFLLVAMFGGFAGSFHCIGMCGGFACGLANVKSVSRFRLLLKNTFYNVGRLTSYAFIGALAGALGAGLIGSDKLVDNTIQADMHTSFPTDGHSSSHLIMPMIFAGEAGFVQSLLSVIAGVLMIFMAMRLLGIHRYVPPSWGRYGGIALARVLNTLVQSERLAASVALGVANGFLPCPLVLAFAAIAAASGSIATGALIMTAFGLGTFPAMLLMGMAGMLLSPVLRQRGVWVSGLFVLFLGLLTVVRGVIPGIHGIM